MYYIAYCTGGIAWGNCYTYVKVVGMGTYGTKLPRAHLNRIARSAYVVLAMSQNCRTMYILPQLDLY